MKTLKMKDKRWGNKYVNVRTPFLMEADSPDANHAAGLTEEKTMTPKDKTVIEFSNIEKQEEYVKRQEAHGDTSLGLFVAESFLRGIRDLGYRNPAWALAEMVDNAIQAGAKRVSTMFKTVDDQEAVDQLAVVDDGVGMIPLMIKYAVKWGGTDRADNRAGFGRYGYGLPSAAVSMAVCYTVYSKTKEDEWHAVTVDLDEVSKVAPDTHKMDALIQPRPKSPPAWVFEESGSSIADFESGTVVVLENLDRLKLKQGWKKVKQLSDKLKTQFGTIYRHWVTNVTLQVAGVTVEPVDPLFQMPDGRFYDESLVTAQRIEPDNSIIEVETSDKKKKGLVTIKASLLPPDFQTEYEMVGGDKKVKVKNKGREEVMKKNHGLSILREGRLIAVVKPRSVKNWGVFDRNVQIEIDFEATLDEYFGITTSKQQIEIDEQMWTKLESVGKNGGNLIRLIADMRKEFMNQSNKRREALEKTPEGSIRPAEKALVDSWKIANNKALFPTTSKQLEQAAQNLTLFVNKEVELKGLDEKTVREELEKDAELRGWVIEFEELQDGTFYSPKRLGKQKRLVISTSHPFYSRVYEPSKTDAQQGLQVLLGVLADAELDANDEQELFYRSARLHWSDRLRAALTLLRSDDKLTASQEGELEKQEMETEKEIDKLKRQLDEARERSDKMKSDEQFLAKQEREIEELEQKLYETKKRGVA
jgi:hypothetical protein